MAISRSWSSWARCFSATSRQNRSATVAGCMLFRLTFGLLVVLAATCGSMPAMAQQFGFDAYCRPLPPPGFMMPPQPVSQVCVQLRAAAARATEAERGRREAAAQTEAAREAAPSAQPEDERSRLSQQEANRQEVRHTFSTLPEDWWFFNNLTGICVHAAVDADWLTPETWALFEINGEHKTVSIQVNKDSSGNVDNVKVESHIETLAGTHLGSSYATYYTSIKKCEVARERGLG
jgi:hypothetical protein